MTAPANWNVGRMSVAAVLIVFGISAMSPGYRDGNVTGQDHVPGEIIVMFQPSHMPAQHNVRFVSPGFAIPALDSLLESRQARLTCPR